MEVFDLRGRHWTNLFLGCGLEAKPCLPKNGESGRRWPVCLKIEGEEEGHVKVTSQMPLPRNSR